MMNAVERILTVTALLIMPFVGLAASAHQAERGSQAAALVYAAVSLIAFVQLARLAWQQHKQRRLHRAS